VVLVEREICLDKIEGVVTMNNTEEHLECMFDSFCKKVLRNERNEAYREKERRNSNEILFSELSEDEKEELLYIDSYAMEEPIYSIYGSSVRITSEMLRAALANLSVKQRDIIYLSYTFDMTDMEIAKALKLPRSTIQYRRVNALKRIQLQLKVE